MKEYMRCKGRCCFADKSFLVLFYHLFSFARCLLFLFPKPEEKVQAAYSAVGSNGVPGTDIRSKNFAIENVSWQSITE